MKNNVKKCPGSPFHRVILEIGDLSKYWMYMKAHDVKGIPILIVLKKNGEQLLSTGKNDVVD